MPDVAELGRKVKRKYPGAYDDLSDADLGRKVKAKYPGAYDDFTDAPAAQPTSFLEDVKIGAERGYRKYLEPAISSLAEVTEGMKSGDFGPALQMAKEAARGTYRALTIPDPRIVTDAAGQQQLQVRPPDPVLQQAQAARSARYAASPEGRRSAERLAALDVRAGQDPSIASKITRGTTEVLTGAAPSLATAIATRGAILPTSIAAGLQSAARPAEIGPQAAAGTLPVPVGQAFRAGINQIRRTFGKGAAQVIEAEVTPAATTQLSQAIPEVPPATSLPSVFTKLETDNVEQIGAMIANANRRYASAKNITPEERLSAWDDYNRLKDLTPDEQRALSQVLPARTYSPVTAAKDYSRNISDIPAGQPDPQLDANLRELEQFFGGQATAPRLAAETGPPALSADMSISAASPSVRAASASVTGPRVGADLDALNVAVSEAAESVPRSQRAKDELLGLFGAAKSLRSTGDASYPLRQGALLLLRPFQWRQAGQVWKENFRAFRTKNFNAIKEAIDTHPLAGRMDAAGLKPFTQAGEEAFARRAGSKISETVSKLPVVKQSGQAYDAAAATQRVQAFQQYAKLIDKAGLSPEEALKADKAAAEWINIATGRGSLGPRIDKAFEALNLAFFSPRYVASRLNVFNPAMYIRNASSPGGRVVLKQQMADLMQFASVAATTMYLAKQAGADVGLNPNSPDFLKVRVGNWRYDPLAGLQQVMRLIYRVGADIGRAGRGEKPKAGQTATDIAETFLSYKLSPPAGVFRDFINQRTVDKKPFTAGRAVADVTVPMQWADFVEAYQKEAWGGVLKAAPGFVGVGAQNYEQTPVDAAIEKSRPLFTELQRLDKRVSELRRKDGEKDDAFNARVQQFGANYTTYGMRLVQDPRFQAAPDALKAIALDRLNERAKQITHKEFAFPEIELDPEIIMDAAESSKKNPANK